MKLHRLMVKQLLLLVMCLLLVCFAIQSYVSPLVMLSSVIEPQEAKTQDGVNASFHQQKAEDIATSVLEVREDNTYISPPHPKLDMSHVEEMKDSAHVPFNTSKIKTILVWNNAYGMLTEGLNMLGDPEELFHAGCPQPNCVVVSDRKFRPIQDFDAIIFHFRSMNFDDWPKKRSNSQRYIFREMEPASYISQTPSKYDGYFNWTFTYRLDSDIPKPYGLVQRIPSSEQSKQTPTADRLPKTKMAAWFVSNCVSKSGRGSIAKFLGKHFPVDTYGLCGPFKCDRRYDGHEDDCYKMVERDYKFYFSFENSLCKDYVTEKFFNILRYRIVPVVFGSADYKNIAPPHSYVNVMDFPSVSKVAEYLLYLAKNDTAYNEYFNWKDEYRSVDNYIVRVGQMCHLCYKLHNDDKEKVYNDLGKWFLKDSKCKHLKGSQKTVIWPKDLPI